MVDLALVGLVAPRRGKADWLTRVLRDAVGTGALPTGTLLPPTRVLAGDLGVSRGVVVEAYRRMVEEGVVDASTAGTRVLGAGPQVADPEVADPQVRASNVPARRPDRVRGVARAPDPGSLPLPPVRDEAGTTDLSPGVPDLAAFPRAAWLRAEQAVLTRADAVELGYGDPRGHPRLRQELSTWLARTRGLRAAPEQLLVVAGVAQALALLAQVLRAGGATRIAVEDPGSRGARDEMAHWGLRPVAVPVDEDGIDVAALARADVPAVLLTPAHQFPTGVVLAPSRRRHLRDWAVRTGALVIEDDYDAEHRYDRAPVAAFHAMAPGHVAHTGSTSKTLAPGLRLGWLVPPAHLFDDLVVARRASDLGSPALPQLVLAELLRTDRYAAHLRLVRVRQRVRRDAVVAALARHLPQARVDGVAAGLHVLVSLPRLDGLVDDTELAASLRGAGIVVHPLSWHRVAPGPPGLVLGYAAHPPQRLEHAVVRLAAVIRSVQPGPGSRRGTPTGSPRPSAGSPG